MACARCGCGIYKTEEFISLNKVWHKYCFTCYQCSKRLDKETAKIFQGELFCESCYTNVIEKLFEVISTPSMGKPCKVASTPSCAVTNNHCFEERLKNCENLLENIDSCKKKEYCFPAENKSNECIQRSVRSCSCIPGGNESKDEYCFIFPIPREVANYYNRSHMKNKAFRDPISCSRRPGTSCSCRNPRCPLQKCQVQVRTLKNQCCCNNLPPSRCGNPAPQSCCCSASPKPPTGPVLFKKGCRCCLPHETSSCDPCSAPNRCAPPCSPSPPCRRCSCCQEKSQPCKTECPQSTYRSPAKCSPPQCCPPARCCSPRQSYVLPPRCPPCRCQKMEGCCCSKPDQSSSENSKKCCHRCCYQTTPKYCICGSLNPCDCKMSQIKTQCTVCCVRCGQKVYAAEKILVSSGAFHTSCFTCFCCKKCLDVKNVFEGCGEIYCQQCYNHFFGVEYYGFGGKNH